MVVCIHPRRTCVWGESLMCLSQGHFPDAKVYAPFSIRYSHSPQLCTDTPETCVKSKQTPPKQHRTRPETRKPNARTCVSRDLGFAVWLRLKNRTILRSAMRKLVIKRIQHPTLADDLEDYEQPHTHTHTQCSPPGSPLQTSDTRNLVAAYNQR